MTARILGWPSLSLRFLVLAVALASRLAGRTPPAATAAVETVPSVPFVGNAGQEDPAIAFSTATFAGRVRVTRAGGVLYPAPGGAPLAERPVRADAGPLPIGERPAETRVSFFLGNDPARWRSGLPTWGAVSLGEVWPGVTLELVAHRRNVEKIFTVAPGARPAGIRMELTGGGTPLVDASGALVVRTLGGAMRFSAPRAWQDTREGRRPVAVAYRLRGNSYGFRIGAHDPALPVVIDPLLQSTYGGGSNFDEAESILVHPTTGDVYVCGRTSSTDFAGTAGGAQASNGSGSDAFVARYNASLTVLLQASYFGGTETDDGQSIALHPVSGDIYVGGRTGSSDLPGTTGAAQASFSGQEDGFIARFNSSLTTLTRATYIGGSSGITTVQTLAVHPSSGEIYAVGVAGSDLPATSGGAQTSSGGAYAVRLPADLGVFSQTTYIGAGSARGVAVAFEPVTGDVFVGGEISDFGLPARLGGAQEEPATTFGDSDAFVSRINTSLTAFVQSTYFGGSGSDHVRAMVFRASTSQVLITGETFSTDIPARAGGAQGTKSSGQEGYVAAIAADLKSFGQSTYVGGSGSYAFGVAVNAASGEILVGGTTSDPALSNVAGGVQPNLLGSGDGFLSRLNGSLTAFLQNTYLGGSAQVENILAIAFAPAISQVYATGSTESADFPGTAGGAQPSKNVGADPDIYIARLTANLKGPRFNTVTPCRVADTRTAPGPYGGPALAGGGNRVFTIVNKCTIPADASAAAFNFTVTGSTAAGDIRIFPGGTALPLVSTLNYRAGQTRANNAILKLGSSGDITVHVDQASGTVQLIIDVTGYFE